MTTMGGTSTSCNSFQGDKLIRLNSSSFEFNYQQRATVNCQMQFIFSLLVVGPVECEHGKWRKLFADFRTFQSLENHTKHSFHDTIISYHNNCQLRNSTTLAIN